MGLFGKFKADREDDSEREELKGKIENLMSDYDDEEIDGPTYIEKMIELTSSYRKKK